MIGRTNQSRSPRRDKARCSSNQISLTGRQGRRLVIQDRIIGSANQKASEHPSEEPSDGSIGSANHIHRSDYLQMDFLRTDHPSRRNRRLSQSHPLDRLFSVGLSSDGLSLDGSSFRLNFRLSESQPSVGLSSVGLSSDRLSSDGSSFGQKPS